MPIILTVTLSQKSKNYASICIISKLAKDKVSSEGKGLTGNRHYAPLAILKHTNVCCRLCCRPLTEKDKKKL